MSVSEVRLDWFKVKTWAEAEVEKLRQRNDSAEASYPDTQVIRGEIRALKRLLALPTTLAQQVSDELPSIFGGTSI
jgi:ubiquinone biosynthesis protein UbiJ